MTIFWMEAFGLCGEGEAFDFIQDGRIAPDGILPINPSGGNLGGGRLHGINHFMDGMLQVSGAVGQAPGQGRKDGRRRGRDGMGGQRIRPWQRSTVTNEGPCPVRESRESIEWKMGGRTVLFSAIGYGTGPILFVTTSSVFIRPTMEATGWSTSEVLLSPLVTVLFTLLGPLVGRIVDRRGVRRAIMIGLVPYLILLILFATLPANRITFYALAAGIGTFGAFGYLVPYSRGRCILLRQGCGQGVLPSSVSVVQACRCSASR